MLGSTLGAPGPAPPRQECDDGGAEGHLQGEVDHLKAHLAERDTHIVALEQEFVKSNAKISDLEEQAAAWREKYERLYDSHKRVQKLNQVLEDKLLQMVDKMKSEKSQLTKDIATLSVRLAQSKHTVSQLHKENERYKNDMNLAIQLLQCKPDNFVSHKLDNLPVDTQTRVSQFVMSKTTKAESPNLPSKNGNENEIIDSNEYEFNISASLMSKILEDSIQDTVTKHCDTCTCNKTQGNLFNYNETYYSVATQTQLNGEMKNSLCINCNGDVKSIHSNISNRSNSPLALRILNNEERKTHSPSPILLMPQNVNIPLTKLIKENDLLNDKIKSEDKLKLTVAVQNDIVKKIGEDLKELKNNFNIEPTTHHRLCDRTKTSLNSSNISDCNVLDVKVNDELIATEIVNENTEPKEKSESNACVVDNISLRKNSHGSMGAMSRTSSIAKSTTSTHKSNTHVGPGPRFCSLRVQAGSKNILLDNAQPDVPPVLYTRQNRCTENILKNDDEIADMIDVVKEKDEDTKSTEHVMESTLVDVHVDSNYKGNVTDIVNPVLMNVSTSPLQPLKAHSFNNPPDLIDNTKNAKDAQVITSIEDSFDLNPEKHNNKAKTDNSKQNGINEKINPMTNTQGMKIFNFDHYEQAILTNQFRRQLRKIDMSQLHSIENTKISKDLPPIQPEVDILQNKEHSKPLPLNIHVYPNITQTQIKVQVTDAKKAFGAEQSTSSLSSDDSAALLHKQQLIRVAEWVQQNMEQQNNFNNTSVNTEPIHPPRNRRDSTTGENLDIVHKMPHPVTKYSNSFKNANENLINNPMNNHSLNDIASPNIQILANTIVKETIFPVECDVLPITEGKVNCDAKKTNFLESIQTKTPEEPKPLPGFSRQEKKVSAEELARMEYNVKKFLLSGSQWSNPGSNTSRSRRTSSKTETDL